MSRRLKISVFRHNPRDPQSVPRLVDYELDEQPGMTLFIALNAIRDTQAPDLNFDFVCRAGVCGACAMVVDGRPGLACRTLTNTLPDAFSLYPLPVFRLVADLSVDTGRWMRELAERLQTWVHLEAEPELDRLEARMEPALAEGVYELNGAVQPANQALLDQEVKVAPYGERRNPELLREFRHLGVASSAQRLDNLGTPTLDKAS